MCRRGFWLVAFALLHLELELDEMWLEPGDLDELHGLSASLHPPTGIQICLNSPGSSTSREQSGKRRAVMADKAKSS